MLWRLYINCRHLFENTGKCSDDHGSWRSSAFDSSIENSFVQWKDCGKSLWSDWILKPQLSGVSMWKVFYKSIKHAKKSYINFEFKNWFESHGMSKILLFLTKNNLNPIFGFLAEFWVRFWCNTFLGVKWTQSYKGHSAFKSQFIE